MGCGTTHDNLETPRRCGAVIWDWDVLLVPGALLFLISILAMFALVFVLFRVGFQHPASIIFASYLVLRAASMAATFLWSNAIFQMPNPDMVLFWSKLQAWFTIPLPFLLLWFASTYPRRRGWLGNSPWAGALLLAVIGILWALYAWNPTLWTTYREIPETGTLWPRLDGPLALTLGMLYLAQGAIAWWFARKAMADPPGHMRQTMLFMSLGFGVSAWYDGVGVLLGILVREAGYDVNLRLLLIVGSAVAVGIAWWELRRAARSTNDGQFVATMRFYSRFMWLVTGSLTLALIDFFLPAEGGLQWLNTVPVALWRLSLPALVTYALLRHHLFDVDLRVKTGFRRGVVVSVFPAVFIITSELIERQLPEADNNLIAVAGAVLVALALSPVQTLAAKIADMAFPAVEGEEDDRGLQRKRVEIYTTTAEMLAGDGILTEKERKTLDRLAARLELPVEMRTQIDGKVLTKYGVS